MPTQLQDRTRGNSPKCLDRIFEYIDTYTTRQTESFFEVLRNSDAILSGSSVMVDRARRNCNESVDIEFEKTGLSIFVEVKKSRKILEYLKRLVLESETFTGTYNVERTRVHSTTSPFIDYQIQTMFGFNLTIVTPMIGIRYINVYLVNNGAKLASSTGILGFDTLSSYYSLTGALNMRDATYHNLGVDPMGSMMFEMNLLENAAQDDFDITYRKYKTGNTKLNFHNVKPPDLSRVDPQYENYTIDRNYDRYEHMDDSDRMFILKASIIDFIKYSTKYSSRGYKFFMYGLTVDEDPNLSFVKLENFIPYFESITDYFIGGLKDIYDFYKKCALYDFKYEIREQSLVLPLTDMTLYIEEGSEEPNVESASLGINRYKQLVFSFDQDYYNTLSDNTSRECYIHQSMFNNMLYLHDWVRDTDYYDKRLITGIKDFFGNFLVKLIEHIQDNCMKTINIDSRIHMGIAAPEFTDDYLDDEDYLIIEKFLEDKKHGILVLEGGTIVPFNKTILTQNFYSDGSNVFFKCLKKMDNFDTIFNVYYKDVNFIEPYFDITGGNEQLSMKLTDFMSVSRSVQQIFYLAKHKTLERLANIQNVNMGREVNPYGNPINIVGGSHCQSGVVRNIYTVNFAKVGEYNEVKTTNTNRKILSIENVFEKYPESKVIFDSRQNRMEKIKMANRLNIEPEYKTRLIQSISQQKMQFQTVIDDSEPETEHYDSEPDDVPERIIGGSTYSYGGYLSDSDSDDEYIVREPTRRRGGIAPMRLDFSDEQVQVLEPQTGETIPVPDREFSNAVRMYLNPATKQQVVDLYGPISEWDVSNVTNMREAFAESDFNEDISRWDVSNVKEMDYMFMWSDFDQPINNWNVENLKSAERMFFHSKLKGPLNKWRFRDIQNMSEFFSHSAYENEDDNLEEWSENIQSVNPNMKNMFKNSLMELMDKVPSWYTQE